MKTLNIFVLISIFITFVNCNAIPESSSLFKDVLKEVNLSNIKVLEDNLVKRQMKIEDTSCRNELEQFLDCLNNNMATEKICKTVSTELCQKFLNDPITYIPSCEKYDKAKAKILYSRIKATKSLENLYCGESCEFSKEMSKDLSTQKSRKEVDPMDLYTPSESAFKSDCTRKECVDKAISLYETLLEYEKVLMENDPEAYQELSSKDEKENEVVEAMLKENLEKYRSCASSSSTSSNANANSNANSNASTPANNTKTDAGKDQSSDTIKMNASNILLFTIITLTLYFLF